MLLTPAQIRKLKRTPLDGRPNKVGLAIDLADLTQVQVAERLKTSQSRVSDVVRGDYVDMPLESSRAWAEFFGVTVDDLFPARHDASTVRTGASA